MASREIHGTAKIDGREFFVRQWERQETAEPIFEPDGVIVVEFRKTCYVDAVLEDPATGVTTTIQLTLTFNHAGVRKWRA